MTKTIIDRIYTQLSRNTESPGISVAQLASRAKTTRATVQKRIFDLRQEGYDIYTNRKLVNGEVKTFYRLAA